MLIARVGRHAGAILRDLIFPPCCAACERPLPLPSREFLCEACLKTVERIRSPLCTVCGTAFEGPEETDHPCGKCIKAPPPFTIARSGFKYDGAVRELLHRIKYKSDGYALKALCDLARKNLVPQPADSDVVVPVPLHGKRLRERGFNQSVRIAKCLFPGTRFIPDLLARTRNTPSQTGLGMAEREENVKGAFDVSRPLPADAGSFLIVDDVFTTGATARACASALKKAGARSIRVFTLARA